MDRIERCEAEGGGSRGLGIRLPASGWEGDAAAGETGYLRSPRPSRGPPAAGAYPLFFCCSSTEKGSCYFRYMVQARAQEGKEDII